MLQILFYNTSKHSHGSTFSESLFQMVQLTNLVKIMVTHLGSKFPGCGLGLVEAFSFLMERDSHAGISIFCTSFSLP
jgi:hypothetical protein